MLKPLSIALVMIMAASESRAATPDLSGVWGGDRAMLTFDGAGGHLRSDCADGALQLPLKTDKSGRFKSVGSFQTYGGGPQAADEQVPKAHYSGRITQDTLVLTVQPDGDQPSQTFTLKRGVRLKIIRCL